MTEALGRRRWLRYSLSHLLILSFGFAIGLGSLGWWQYRQPRPYFHIGVQVYEMPLYLAQSLSLFPKQGQTTETSAGPLFDPSLLSKLEARRLQDEEIKCIAEPTLVTINGYQCSFSAGGEIPYPAAGPKGSTTIEYRKFGQEVSIVPTLLPGRRIQLKVRSQFSNLNESRKLTVAGFELPELKSRSIDTEMETASGQSSILTTGGADGSEPEKSTVIVMVITPWLKKPGR